MNGNTKYGSDGILPAADFAYGGSIMKKTISLVLALVLLTAILPGASAVGFYTGTVDPNSNTSGMYTPDNQAPVISLIPGTEPQQGWTDPTQPVWQDPNQSTWTEPWTNVTNAPLPVVTKSPTTETVKEGEFAYFVARADNCADIIWHLISPGGVDVPCKDANSFFRTLQVQGLNTETLTLRNIPIELDGWKVRAEFVGWEASVNSEEAVIHVQKSQVKAPAITEQPMSVSLEANKATTLRATAVTDAGNTLAYQWYKSSFNLNSGGQVIPGATSNVYTPDYAEGTTYYYCVITCSDGTMTSEASKTECAAVTYAPVPTQPTVPPTQATVPPIVPTTAPTQPTTAPATEATISWTASATQPDTPPVTTQKNNSNNSLLILIIGVILFLAILGIIATVLILRFYSADDEEDEQYDKPMPKKPSGRSYENAKREYATRPSVPRNQPPKPQKRTTADKYQRPVQTPAPQDDSWDDLSDLGDLSIYFDEDDQQ